MNSSMGITSSIGVVVPVYNRSSILIETLSYVLEQSHQPTQLVIVDDGSTDDTAEAVRSWLSRQDVTFPWRVLRTENRGPGAARNHGLEALDEMQYVAFLDSDDHWPIDFLARCVSAMQSNPGSVAASVDRLYVEEDEQSVLNDTSQIGKSALAFLFLEDAGISSCSLLDYKQVKAIDSWDENLESGEDLVLFSGLAERGPWLYVPGIPVRFNRNTQASGEEGNLSRRRPSMYVDWAILYEDVYESIPPQPAGLDSLLRRGVSRKWQTAGRITAGDGAFKRAEDCHHRALLWRPGFHTARVYWLIYKYRNLLLRTTR